MSKKPFNWKLAAAAGGGALLLYPMLRASNVPRYSSGPLKGKVNLAALFGQEYAEVARRNGSWSVAAGEPLYSYNARLTPTEADSLIKSWEARISVIDREQSDTWKRWKASFLVKYGTYHQELGALVTAMQANRAAAAQAYAAGQTADKRFLQTVKTCSSAYYAGFTGSVPTLSCFLPLAALQDASGGSLAAGAAAPGKYFSFGYSSKIWYQLRTLAQALSTWEITAATAPQPRFSDELPPVLSHIARAGECMADKQCREKYALKFPDIPDFGGMFGSAIKWSMILGGGYLGYKLLVPKGGGK